MASRSAVTRRALGARLGGVREPWLRRAAVFGAPAVLPRRAGGRHHQLGAARRPRPALHLAHRRDTGLQRAGLARMGPAAAGVAALLRLLAAYDYLRGAVSVTAAQAQVVPQIDFDKALFGGPVPSGWLQQRLWDVGQDVHWYDYAAWIVDLTASLRRPDYGRGPGARRPRALPPVRRRPRSSLKPLPCSPPTGPIPRSLRAAGGRRTPSPGCLDRVRAPTVPGDLWACRAVELDLREQRSSSTRSTWPCRRCTPRSR